MTSGTPLKSSTSGWCAEKRTEIHVVDPLNKISKVWSEEKCFMKWFTNQWRLKDFKVKRIY